MRRLSHAYTVRTVTPSAALFLPIFVLLYGMWWMLARGRIFRLIIRLQDELFGKGLSIGPQRVLLFWGFAFYIGMFLLFTAEIFGFMGIQGTESLLGFVAISAGTLLTANIFSASAVYVDFVVPLFFLVTLLQIVVTLKSAMDTLHTGPAVSE